MKNRIYFKIKVKLLDGSIVKYQLPNDLQQAMYQHYLENRKGNVWKQMLKDALINVPNGAYTKENNYQPNIMVGKIVNVYYHKSKSKERSRGQFLTSDNYLQSVSPFSLKHFMESNKFLTHDYRLTNKLRITVQHAKWLYRINKERKHSK